METKVECGLETLKRFLGRKDVYAEQGSNGSYFLIKTPITDKDLEAHLAGKRTLGSYVVKENGKVNFGCIDIDGDKEDLATSERLGELILGFFPEFDKIFEFSGRRGYHVWILLDEDESPLYIRELINTRLRMHGLSNIEVFPKQDKVQPGKYGNLVKLPCGKHKQGGWSKILKIIPRENGKQER